ncbi:MAG: MFS transporter [Pseudomonadota bacterium]
MPAIRFSLKQSFPLVATLALQAMVTIAIMAVPVIAPVVAAAFGISTAYAGLYVGLVYAGAIAGSLAAGGTVRGYGAIRISQVGLLLSTAGLLLTVTGWLPAVVLGALVLGLGYALITPASSHLLARTTPAQWMSLVFSLKQTGVPLGGAIAGAVVPALALGLGWRGALLALAVCNLLCIAAAQPLRRELDSDRTGGGFSLGKLYEPLLFLRSQPALARLTACVFIFSVVQLSLTTYLVTYLTGSLGYGLVAAGLVHTVSQSGGMVGRVLWGFVADRWLDAPTMLAILAAVMCVASLATALLAPWLPVWAVCAVLLVYGATAVGWNGVFLAEVARQAPPGMAAMATGGTLAVTFLGSVIGPPLFGALSAWYGSYRAGFGALVPLTALCFWGLMRIRRSERRLQPA